MGLTRDRTAVEEEVIESIKNHNESSCESLSLIDFIELLNLLSEAHKLLLDIEDKIRVRLK